MKQIDRILIGCGNGETSLKEIADMLKWKNSAAAVTINELVKKGLLRKTRHGFYIATKNGQEKIKQIVENEQNSHGDINYLIYRTAALYTTSSRFTIMETIKYEKESLRPSPKTKQLGEILEKIYRETVLPMNVNHVDVEFLKSTWRYHQSPVCECGFNFEKAYENNKEELEKFEKENKIKIDKNKIFRNLRWESYPDIEKYKKNFHLPTSFKEPDLPDNWNY